MANKNAKGDFMNPVFVFLVICGAVILWFLLYKLFQPLGKLLNHIGKNAIDELNKDESQNKEDDK